MTEGRRFSDTTDFFSIDYGDEILIGGRRYRVTGHERETRFGLDDPKFWVKKVVDTETGDKKILKLCFYESFETTLAGVKIRCFRDPEKEAEILELVREHPHFMQGVSFRDEKGNNVRLLDIVKGPNFYIYIDSLNIPYEKYFQKALPNILKSLVRAFEGIRLLHSKGYKHGDIRNDHIIVERESGNYIWIDFDYDYDAEENPFGLDLFGLGSILLYAVGKGFHDLYSIRSNKAVYGDLEARLRPGDFSILDRWRLTNLRKLYPCIPVMLNDVLMHFSMSAEIYYEVADEILEDLNRCIYSYF